MSGFDFAWCLIIAFLGVSALISYSSLFDPHCMKLGTQGCLYYCGCTDGYGDADFNCVKFNDTSACKYHGSEYVEDHLVSHWGNVSRELAIRENDKRRDYCISRGGLA